MAKKIEERYEIGQDIESVNPQTGKLETGTVTGYARDNVSRRRRNATGLMVRFSSNNRSVEIDGEFLN